MQEYGIITNGILIRKKSMTPGYKPIKYGDIPEVFYEESHYLIESKPVEHDDYIQVDYVAKEIQIDIDEDSEATLEEIQAGIEERKEKYFKEKNKKEVSEIDILKAQIKTSSDYVDFLEGVVVELIQAAYQ